MRRSAFVPVLLAALGLAGCGTTGNSPGPNAAGAPSTPGAMSIGVTDGRLGGAITDSDSERERELSKARPIDPRVLRPAPNVREGVGAADQCANADMLPDGSNLAAVSVATLCLLNAERADRGLTALKVDRELQQAALGHGNDMVANRYFAHEGRDGSKPAQRIRAAGYLSDGGAWRIGENLAWGTGELASPKAIMAAWMNSPGHRANILMPAYREVGFGVIAGNPRSGDGSGATFVTEFGVVERAARLRLAPRPQRQRPPRRLARPPRLALHQAPRRQPPRTRPGPACAPAARAPASRSRRARARAASSAACRAPAPASARPRWRRTLGQHRLSRVSRSSAWSPPTSPPASSWSPTAPRRHQRCSPP